MIPSIYYRLLIYALLVSLNACTHTKESRHDNRYEELRKTRFAVNNALASKKLPESIKGVSGVIDRELTWLASLDYRWQCQLLQHSKAGDGVIHRKLTCKGSWPKEIPEILLRHKKSISGLVVNLVDIDFSANQKLRLQPAIAENNSQFNFRQPLIGIAESGSKKGETVLAGINGGYFFIPPVSARKPFLDSNCLSNFYLNFEKPPFSSWQIGDGLLVINGQALSYNCKTVGPFSPPRTSFMQNKSGLYQIAEMPAGKSDVSRIKNALGAGPGLISNGEIAIKSEFIPSTLEFSANTALVLGQDTTGHKHAVLFTVDGRDGSKGMYAFEVANFLARTLPDYVGIKVQDAMSMDQGGSTGMVVREYGKLKTVSHSGDQNRPIYNALLVVE